MSTTQQDGYTKQMTEDAICRLDKARLAVLDAERRLYDTVSGAHGLLTVEEIVNVTGLSGGRVRELRPGYWGGDDVPF